jgi:hypothetical protein
MGGTISSSIIKFCEFCGILWNFVEFCGILWNFVEFCGILWNFVEFCGILWTCGVAMAVWRGVAWRCSSSKFYNNLDLPDWRNST